MKHSIWQTLSFLILVLIISSVAAHAQTNLETNAGIQFNFVSPGAANLALGGAFIGSAYDATAAFTNPAGLALLVDREITAEIRYQNYRHVFTDHGRIEGRTLTTDFELDVPGLRESEAENSVLGLTFLSFTHRAGPIQLGFYRHELVNFEAEFSTQGAFLEETITRDPTGIPGGRDGRLASVRNEMDLRITGYGLAAAYEPFERFSVGLALTYHDFSLNSLAERFVPLLNRRPDFERDPVINFQIQTGEDHDLGATVGFLWRSPQESLQLGLVYRHGPDFSFRAISRPTSHAPIQFLPAEQEAIFHVPHLLGLGMAFQPRDRLHFGLDLIHIQYSRLTEDFVDIFRLDQLFSGLDAELDQFRVDDGLEVHLGVEYTLPYRSSISLRAGVWFDPDHTLYFQGNNEAFRAIFRPRVDEFHFTFGAGLLGRRFQVDAAADLSPRVDTLSTTLTLRLP